MTSWITFTRTTASPSPTRSRRSRPTASSPTGSATPTAGFVWVESVVDEELAPEFGGARRHGASRRRRADLPGAVRGFLEYGTDLVTVVDADGRVRYESPAVEEVLGYEQGSTVGRSPLGYVHPDDRERVTERFYRALNDPDATPTMEYRYRTADGNWVWLESRSRSLPDDVAVGRLLINSRDVSERKRARARRHRPQRAARPLRQHRRTTSGTRCR